MSTAKSSTLGVLIISVYDIDTAQRGLFAHFFLLSPTSIHHTLFLFFFYSDPCYADQSLRFFSLYSHYRPKRMFILPQSFPYQARGLRVLGLLLADGTPTVGGGKTF